MSRREHTYQNALRLLKQRRRPQRPVTKSVFASDAADPQNDAQRPNWRGRPSCDGMRGWLRQIGHSDAVIDGLKLIHVAGTKGKGSTCAFTEAFLCAHRHRTGWPEKYGLYTSPALREESERIRINSEQISNDIFAESVFEVWNGLNADDKEHDDLPKFLQMVFLVCIHIFIKEQVGVAVIETHHGGEFDSTNIFPHPVAAGVTTLGFDHVAQLGPTIRDIAWHKAGIFKQGSPAFSTANQPDEARPILLGRAKERQTSLEFVEIDPMLPLDHKVITPTVQRLNCSLAKALVSSFLKQSGRTQLHENDVMFALDNLNLPGRFQQIQVGNENWCLDGAHNTMSIVNAIEWFSRLTQTKAATQAGKERVARLLIFSQISTERDGEEVLRTLISSVESHELSFDYVVFCYDGTREDGSSKYGKEAHVTHHGRNYASIWKDLSLPGEVMETATIDETVATVRENCASWDKADILVTGSFHVVGGMLLRLK